MRDLNPRLRRYKLRALTAELIHYKILIIVARLTRPISISMLSIMLCQKPLNSTNLVKMCLFMKYSDKYLLQFKYYIVILYL